jgi:hypothetical protein
MLPCEHPPRKGRQCILTRGSSRSTIKLTSGSKAAPEAPGTDEMGIEEFYSLADAIRAGYQVCGQTDVGYLVRRMTPAGWAMAAVIITRNS